MPALHQHLDPGSRSGLRSDLAWLALTAVVFAAIAVVEPIPLTVTAETLVGSLLLGGVLGVALVFVLLEIPRVRSFWESPGRRFLALFVLVMAVQGLLAVAPSWTVLTTLFASLAGIPARLGLYYWYRA